jgi:HK97 family phage prohead protease
VSWFLAYTLGTMSFAKAPVFLFEVKAVAEDGTFSGYAAVFGNVDRGRDVCAKGCFGSSLKDHAEQKTMPGLYWGHDSSEPIGEWTLVREDDRGLYVEGKLWIGAGIPKAEQAYRLIKSAGPKGLSIGYVTVKSSIDERAGVRRLEQLDLKEVSVVSFPMNDQARIISAKNGGEAAGLEQAINRLVATIRGSTR